MHGVQGHVAYPQLAENPVHTLAPALAELTRRQWDQGTEHFQPTSFQVSNLNAGTGAPNVIPGELQARASTCATPRCRRSRDSRQTVEEILRRHGVRYTLEWYVSGEPFYTPPGTLSRGGERGGVRGERPRGRSSPPAGAPRTGASSRPLGAQVVELGVVNASIHKVNESVRVADIDALHAMYFNVLRRLLGLRLPMRPEGAPGRAPTAATQAGIASPRKRQLTCAALPAAGEHLADHLKDRRELQQHRQRRAAGGQRARRQALHVDMPGRHGERGERRHADEHAVHARGRAPRG